MIRVAVIGATGRMGEALLAALPEERDMTLTVALTRGGNEHVGHRVRHYDIDYRDDIGYALNNVDVAVDFATADGVDARAAACASSGTPWLLGTTGLDARQQDAVVEASKLIPVLFSANMSLGVNACFDVAASLARVLGEAYDVDIVDLHHRHKKDAPSGTALEFGRVVAAAWGKPLKRVTWRDTHDGARPRGTVAFASLRAGSHPGEHRIVFSGASDTVELVHRASQRGAFAQGALKGARWLAGQPPGLYDMADFIHASTER